MSLFAIAFAIVFCLVVLPVWWVGNFAASMSGQFSNPAAAHDGGVPLWVVVVISAAIAFVAAIIVVGLWALAAPLFGG